MAKMYYFGRMVAQMTATATTNQKDIDKKDLYMLNATTSQTTESLGNLSAEEHSYENSLIRKHIVTWDPDFTKVTAKELELLESSDFEMKNGDYIKEEDFWE